MRNESPEHDDSSEAVDIACGLESAQKARQPRGPGSVGKLQEKAGQCQRQKTANHAGVQDPVVVRKTHEFAMVRFRPYHDARITGLLHYWRLNFLRSVGHGRHTLPPGSLGGCEEDSPASASRASSALSSRRICKARGSQSMVCSPPMVNVPRSSAVIPQKV